MTGNQDIFQKAMNSGHSAAWDQLWDRAAAFYGQALAEFPDNPKALTSLGLALIELQRYDEALMNYTKAAKLLPDDPVPMEKIAQICERLGRQAQTVQASLRAADLYTRRNDNDRAIENWRRAIQTDPDNLTAYTRMAVLYERAGRRSDAVQAYLAVASLVQRAGETEKAIQAVNRALQIAPENTDAKQALNIIRNKQVLPRPSEPRGSGPAQLMQMRSPGSAGGTASATLPVVGVPSDSSSSELDPINEARQRTLVQMADILFEQNEERMEELTQRRGLGSIMRGDPSKDQTNSPQIILHLGQAIDSSTKGQTSQAVVELEHAIRAGLNHPAGFFNLGLLLAQQNNIEPALHYLSQIDRESGYELASNLLQGQLLRKTDDLNGSAVHFLEALRIADSSTVSAIQEDELSQLYDPLIESIRREIDKEKLATLCDNINSQLNRQGWKGYLKRTRDNLPSQPDGSPPMPLAEMLLQTSSSQVIESMATIRLLASQGFVRTAVEEAYHAIQYAPTYLPLHVQIGELLLQDQRTQDAIDKFSMVSQIFQVRGDMVQSIKMLRRVVQLSPMDLNTRSHLIDLLISRDQVDEAIREYTELANMYTSLADLDNARKTYATAMRLVQQSKASKAWSVEILRKMGDIDLQRLDWRQATRVFEQLKNLQPDDEKARGQLIDLNFRLGQDAAALTELDNYLLFLDSAGARERGIAFLTTFLQERPEKTEVHRRLAELYRRSGRMREAVAELDKMGDMLLSAGNRSAAAAVIQTILSLNPPNAAEYRRLLTQLQNPNG